ncbi:MAG: ribbon-helix-helix domain-containing protein [Actinobacteria bacterium]|nr:ribbon-helix-helix domain-containing protein [Actinomycetota bacterium]
MSKRLQVILQDEDADELSEAARADGVTVSEWVRQMIRRARSEKPAVDTARTLAAVRAAARHSFPTADIDEMLAEIERGYSSN